MVNKAEVSSEIIFLKLGGSLITDKTGIESVRADILRRIAIEIKEARRARPEMKILLGHGSGSFGHIAASKYGTRRGVRNANQWSGFAKVSSAAARLNAFVREALLDAELPAITLQPSASAICEHGVLIKLSSEPMVSALNAGLLPIIYGDVAFDFTLGGTIISTEEIMSFVARDLTPQKLLLAGETDGVLDSNGQTVPLITPTNFKSISSVVGGSRGTDVTGGMASKVANMLDLVMEFPELSVQIFSGLKPGILRSMLLGEPAIECTVIQAS